MITYDTEEEQVEAIKRWWKENGKSVIGGIVLGLAVVGGLKGWQQYTKGRAETAGGYYASFTVSAQGGDIKPALEQGQRLVSEFGKSVYAVFSALEMAKLQYGEGNSDGAIEQLQWVMDNAAQKPLQALAQLRMTRVLVDQGELQKASELISSSEGFFASEYAVITGDIAVANNDNVAARAAYTSALTQNVANAVLVRIKLADLGE